MQLATVSKAIAGALATAIAAWLSQQGFVIDQGFTGALAIVLASVITFVGVYIAPPNKTTKKK